MPDERMIFFGVTPAIPAGLLMTSIGSLQAAASPSPPRVGVNWPLGCLSEALLGEDLFGGVVLTTGLLANDQLGDQSSKDSKGQPYTPAPDYIVGESKQTPNALSMIRLTG